MGFSLSKSATQVSAIHSDSKVEDHLIRRTEKTRLRPVTQLFQNTGKIRLEATIQGENFTVIEETGTQSHPGKALSPVTYVKERDGLEMIDVE
ncbi:uncharacterized protein C2orf15 homolog [Phascolarctos cinereus]|uniref:Uncharacterized protein C2orf15 homolog n=1 Tax=Phascolarctos cinereus TaxID=38626 RepID=A0A6P5KS00_PHACI|nr:uncharacterized protein C2orf15 homolog [Phascolarctos cinereus]XP_020848501.1 uncharacterized protein C2orf15 homolog [Phascolarctos cinereus]